MLFLLFMLALPRSAAHAQESRTLRHALFGDIALELRSPARGSLSIGVADATHAVVLDVRATDARRWSDSVSRLITRVPARPKSTARQRVRRRNSATKDGSESNGVTTGDAVPIRRERVVLEEPGVGAGTLVMSLIDSAATTQWLLYASDAELVEIRQLLDAEEARTLVRVIRSAAIAVAPAPLKAPKKKGAPRRAPAKSGVSPARHGPA